MELRLRTQLLLRQCCHLVLEAPPLLSRACAMLPGRAQLTLHLAGEKRTKPWIFSRCDKDFVTFYERLTAQREFRFSMKRMRAEGGLVGVHPLCLAALVRGGGRNVVGQKGAGDVHD